VISKKLVEFLEDLSRAADVDVKRYGHWRPDLRKLILKVEALVLHQTHDALDDVKLAKELILVFEHLSRTGTELWSLWQFSAQLLRLRHDLCSDLPPRKKVIRYFNELSGACATERARLERAGRKHHDRDDGNLMFA